MVLACLALLVFAGACTDSDAQRPATPTATPATPSTGSDQPPSRDLADLAQRFSHLANATPQGPPPAPVLGKDQEFDLVILPTDPEERPERTTVSATLRAVSEHAYLFVQDDADVGDADVDAAASAFEDEVWPQVTGAFGPPAIPGIDGDPRIVILHADLGPAAAGYVSGEDAYPPTAAPYSNQREMVYMNVNVKPLASPYYLSVLAHELQHLIHARRDADEEAWVNEGLSMFAGALVGEGELSYSDFLEQPDTQLNDWEQGPGSYAHYEASDLFFAYLLEQSEGDVRQLAAEPADGIEGVRAFLRDTGTARTFPELVADWAVANLLDQPQGRYGYRGREVGPPATIAIDGPGQGEGEVHQFAADYLEVPADGFTGEPIFTFEGEAEVPVLAAQTAGDGALWWSNRGDNIDTTLTRELDLTGVQQATLTFRTWFDIERWFDYAYVAASSDGGQTWTALSGRHTTTDDPLEVSYGPAYTGRSGGEAPRWVDERIDLSAYAGSRVLLRFEYVTDDTESSSGWAIDDIAVPEIGFSDDAESDAGGWRREGFQRLTEPLPQRFQLRLIKLGAAPQVEKITLDGANRAQVRLTGLGTEYERAVIVIVGATEGTTEPGRYRYELTIPPAE